MTNDAWEPQWRLSRLLQAGRWPLPQGVVVAAVRPRRVAATVERAWVVTMAMAAVVAWWPSPAGVR
jgi:hypothetical protein